MPATAPSLELSHASIRAPVPERRRLKVAAITALFVLAAVIRIHDLGASGFSEDEINKLRAVEAYRRHDFTANAEHPMLMKLAVWLALDAADWWNRRPALARIGRIRAEAALRLPNTLAGAAAAPVVALLAQALFDPTVGAWAGLLWALDLNAAAINRIGKEDTFLVLFLLLASYLYERAKAAQPTDPVRAARWFHLSAAAFGLMLASKYMPHYFGTHALFSAAANPDPRDTSPDKRRTFYMVLAGAFLAADAVLLAPPTWRYLVRYAAGDFQLHSGYNFAHHLYVNAVTATLWGVPPWFYLAFFATKVPLSVLLFAAAGLVWVARHPRHRGAVFLRVFVTVTLLPLSLVGAKFLRYMLPVLALMDIAAAVAIAALLRRAARAGGPHARLAAAALAAAVVVLPATVELHAVGPYYGLVQNMAGALVAPRGSLFPDDELYDTGVREAVAAVARQAAPGAVVCSDSVSVVAEYLREAGRPDLESRSIAHDGLPMRPVETWVLVQDGHTYFENAGVIEQLRRRLRPWREIAAAGVPAVQVFRLTARER